MLDDVQTAKLEQKISAHGLAAHAEAIIAAAKSSIRLTATGAAGGADESRLGGGAAMPLNVAWPQWKGRDQALIAQIILSDVAHLDREGLLPRQGRLLFFYDQEQETWGFDPKDRGSWTVMFVADGTPAQDPEGSVYSPRRLEPSSEISIPAWESLAFNQLGLSEGETDAYFALVESLQEDRDLVHKLLGYPDPVQGPMEVACQFASNGIYCGDADADQDPRADGLRAGAGDWRLLLQVDSEEAAGMMWGDVGRLYYWIREADLREADFTAAWFQLQCC